MVKTLHHFADLIGLGLILGVIDTDDAAAALGQAAPAYSETIAAGGFIKAIHVAES